jgi:hypothetical protein
MRQPRRFVLALCAVTLVIISCDVSTLAGSSSVPPTPIPGALDLYVAQTAGAAATQTAQLIPPTLTPSPTAFPTFTPPDTETITPTFIFVLLTPIGGGGGGGTSTSGGGTSGTAGSEYACSRLGKSPSSGAAFSSGQKFTASWQVSNAGSVVWSNTTVDLDFVPGSGSTNMSFPLATVFDFPSSVGVGSTITLSVPMKAPSASGSYTGNWTLVASHKTFCSLTISIKVK